MLIAVVLIKKACRWTYTHDSIGRPCPTNSDRSKRVSRLLHEFAGRPECQKEVASIRYSSCSLLFFSLFFGELLLYFFHHQLMGIFTSSHFSFITSSTLSLLSRALQQSSSHVFTPICLLSSMCEPYTKISFRINSREYRSFFVTDADATSRNRVH